MTELIAYVGGVAVKGPGLADWSETEAVLAHGKPYIYAATILPAPEALPPTERRRTGRVVKLALAVGFELTQRAQRAAADLPVVFASSGGDGDNCDAICRTLASDNRALSPTRFHNSVHNAPAGYWSIAAAAQVPTTTVCAYDGSFAAGLLEALAQVATAARGIALIAYDLDYPPPLAACRPVPAPFGLALLLEPERSPRSIARLAVRLGSTRPAPMAHAELERLRASIPAARGLPLLEALARRSTATVAVEYAEPTTLSIDVTPCG